MALIDDHPRLTVEQNRERRKSIINNGGKTAGSLTLAGSGLYCTLETLFQFAQSGAGQFAQSTPSDGVVTLTMTFSAAAIAAGLAGAKRYYSRTVDRIEGIGIPKSAAKTSPERVARPARIHQAQHLIHHN
jgi:hypothetical protein